MLQQPYADAKHFAIKTSCRDTDSFHRLGDWIVLDGHNKDESQVEREVTLGG